MKNGETVRLLNDIRDDDGFLFGRKGDEVVILDTATFGREVYPILVNSKEGEFFVKESEIEPLQLEEKLK